MPFSLIVWIFVFRIMAYLPAVVFLLTPRKALRYPGKKPLWVDPRGTIGAGDYLLRSVSLFLIGTALFLTGLHVVFAEEYLHHCHPPPRWAHYGPEIFNFVILPAWGLFIFTTFSITLQRLRAQNRPLLLSAFLAFPYFGAFIAVPSLLEEPAVSKLNHGEESVTGK